MKEMQSFLGIMNYLSKYSSVTSQMCEPLRRLTSVKLEWTWNKTYQELYETVKIVIKKDVCMKFFYEKGSYTLKQMYQEFASKQAFNL